MEKYQFMEIMESLGDILAELRALTSLQRQANEDVKESKRLYDEVMGYARERYLRQMRCGGDEA